LDKKAPILDMVKIGLGASAARSSFNLLFDLNFRFSIYRAR